MYDQHLHSVRSRDGHSDINDISDRAKEIGLKGVTLTDHWESDILVYSGEANSWRSEFTSDLPDNMLLGIELGSPHSEPKDAEALLASLPFDFVLGSIHAAPKQDDYALFPTNSRADTEAILSEYLAEHMTMLSEFRNFDVFAHIGYPLRYIESYGVTMEEFYDEHTKLFRALIQAGKGIEVNTDRGKLCVPGLERLKLYRSLGGEIITIGSDAHYAEAIGKGLKEAAELLKAAGFEYYTVFEHRKPRFEKIP
jgi:histidinol-phosphatase (PHP family)